MNYRPVVVHVVDLRAVDLRAVDIRAVDLRAVDLRTVDHVTLEDYALLPSFELYFHPLQSALHTPIEIANCHQLHVFSFL